MKMRKAFEVNFDGLPGPTHNYAGLSTGNLASTTNQGFLSNPREAALQSLRKMKFLSDLGIRQGVIPPHERPDVRTLRSLGFQGTDGEVLSQAAKKAPRVLTAVCSASSMWTANAATVSPSADSADQKVHFTPANLSNKFHRSLEPETTSRVLKSVFSDSNFFEHHPPLPAGEHFGDEGAANHTRLCAEYGAPGLQLFVFGKYAFEPGYPKPIKFPARQTFEASSAIIRRHRLSSDRFMLIQQNPEAIDSGIFHNDVISVGNRNVFFYHETAFLEQNKVILELSDRFRKLTGEELCLIPISTSQIGIEDVVRSYLFNSQLVSTSDKEMVLIVPSECNETQSVRSFLEGLLSKHDHPIRKIQSFDLRESMQNGGGPACLRLRVVLTDEELQATNPKTLMNDKLFEVLNQWVKKHYRDRLSFQDLSDASLLEESRRALDELTQTLGLGSVYPFQIDAY